MNELYKYSVTRPTYIPTVFWSDTGKKYVAPFFGERGLIIKVGYLNH